MATERKPWPTWAADGYTWLKAYSHLATRLTNQAIEIQHHNVYLTSNILLRLFNLGQNINTLAKETQMRQKEDDRQWPKWASAALNTAQLSGLYIKAGAKHGLGGLNLDGNGNDNWKQVTKGLSICIEHAHKIEAAINSGPAPLADFVSEDLMKTLDMGQISGNGRWRRNNK